MKYTIYLSEKEKQQLEFEVVSRELKIYFTRLLQKKIRSMSNNAYSILLIQNKIINISRQLLGKPILMLEADDDGEYDHYDFSINECEFNLVLRLLDTIKFVEFLCELVEIGYYNKNEINDALEKENLSFRIEKKQNNINVKVFDIVEIEEQESSTEHSNIRLLINRMTNAMKESDYPAVLHTSASIFETMAKDIIGIESIDDKTLKSFFERYRKDSKLPSGILDYILSIYDNRNTEPLAGHGSINIPKIKQDEAIILSEMTKAFVKIEYMLTKDVC